MTYQYKYLGLVFDEQNGEPLAELERKVPMGSDTFENYEALGTVHYGDGLCRWFLENVYCRPLPGSLDAITASEFRNAIEALEQGQKTHQAKPECNNI